MIGRLCSLLMFCAFICPAPAQAQTLTGRVVDPQGAVVVGALVTVNAPGRSPRTVQTRADGTFEFDEAPPGTYALRVESAGFTTLNEELGLTYLFSALTATIQFVATEQQLSAIIQWTFGSLNGSTWDQVVVVGTIVLVTLPVCCRRMRGR
jgi:hypothetical protein